MSGGANLQHGETQGDMKNMVDYSMDDDKWNGRKADIDEWYEANPDHIGIKVTTDGIFSIGDGQPQLRKKHWAAIGSMFAHLGKLSPVGSGRRSLMDSETKSRFEEYLLAYEADALAIFEGSGYVRTSARLHGMSGGAFYRNMEDGADEYAAAAVGKESLFLNAAYNAHSKNKDKQYTWDGTYTDDGFPNVLDNGPVGGSEEE